MLTSVYLIAIIAEAMSGALAAGRRNMDLFGVAVIAFLTALGGGTVRDILLGNFPVTWTQHPSYIYMTLIGGLVTIAIARFMRHLRQLFLVLDAIGLVAFTIIGCNVALELGYEPRGGHVGDHHRHLRRDYQGHYVRPGAPGAAPGNLRLCVSGGGRAVPVPAAPGRGRGRDATGRVQRRPAAAHGGDPLACLAAGVPLFAGALGLGSG